MHHILASGSSFRSTFLVRDDCYDTGRLARWNNEERCTEENDGDVANDVDGHVDGEKRHSTRSLDLESLYQTQTPGS